MIIVCPCGEKKFEIDQNLIPEAGRLLQCGFCNEKWFFKNKVDIDNDNSEEKAAIFNNENLTETKKDILENKIDKIINKKTKALVEYQKSYKITFGKFLGYIIVLLISFIGLILILDTFKSPLYNFFPGIDLLLFNLYETLKDMGLFIKDLI